MCLICCFLWHQHLTSNEYFLNLLHHSLLALSPSGKHEDSEPPGGDEAEEQEGGYDYGRAGR